jgi:hypothetical protein
LLPTLSQRITAIYLLHEQHRTEALVSNPLTSVFSTILEASVHTDPRPGAGPYAHSEHEKHFLSLLLKGAPKDLFKRSPQQVRQVRAITNCVVEVFTVVL